MWPIFQSFEKSVEINTIGLIQAFSFRRGLFLCLLISNFGDVIKVETDFFCKLLEWKIDREKVSDWITYIWFFRLVCLFVWRKKCSVSKCDKFVFNWRHMLWLWLCVLWLDRSTKLYNYRFETAPKLWNIERGATTYLSKEVNKQNVKMNWIEQLEKQTNK